MKKILLLTLQFSSIAIATSCHKPVIHKTMFYGNVITLDDKKTTAEAVGVDTLTGKINFIGTKAEAKKLIDNETIETDYGQNYIYPGFVDAHSHPGMLGSGIASGLMCLPTDTKAEVYAKINAYIKENPDKEFYKVYGPIVSIDKNSEQHYTCTDIDKNVPCDKPIIICDYSGHSACLNVTALYFLRQYLGIRGDDEYAAEQVRHFKWTDIVQLEEGVDPNKPDKELINGNICESPFYQIYLNIPVDKNELKECILLQQEAVLAKMGYTTIADCGVKSDTIETVQALSELGQEGKLKFKVRAFYNIMETDNKHAKEQIDKVLELKAKYDNEYFKIVGVKFFIDGVNEKETAFTKHPYVTNPHTDYFDKYYGINRWDPSWRPIMPDAPDIFSIVALANQKGLSATVHAYGDAAVRYALDEYQKARTLVTYDRNSISHCAAVDSVDLPRFKELDVTPIVAPHWSYRHEDSDSHDICIYGDVGTETYNGGDLNLDKLFKIKSFLGEDGTNRIAFHTDAMCPNGVPYMLYTAVNRIDPDNAIEGVEGYLPPRGGESEKITLAQALEASTKSPAFLLGEEESMGSIEIGKCGDFSIYPVDFTKDENFTQDKYEVVSMEKTPLIATYLNGKIAYDSKALNN